MAQGFFTPLRYPGGKGKLAPFMKLVLEQNQLIDGHYVEAYAGGAGIAMELLLQEYVTRVHLNDLNPSVFAFWSAAISRCDELCSRISRVRVSMAEWRRQKAVQLDARNADPLDLAFSTFFLNRTNRSGIISGGVIGGKGQTGDWKLDARFNKVELCSRIQAIARYAHRIRLYNIDAADFIRDVLPGLPDRTLVYLDPPYYLKGQELYENHYAHDDHRQIARLIRAERRLPWIVSYDHNPSIVQFYGKAPSLIYGINYSAQDRYKGSEIMFFSRGIMIPDVENPTKANAA